MQKPFFPMRTKQEFGPVQEFDPVRIPGFEILPLHGEGRPSPLEVEPPFDEGRRPSVDPGRGPRSSDLHVADEGRHGGRERQRSLDRSGTFAQTKEQDRRRQSREREHEMPLETKQQR